MLVQNALNLENVRPLETCYLEPQFFEIDIRHVPEFFLNNVRKDKRKLRTRIHLQYSGLVNVDQDRCVIDYYSHRS